VDETTGVKHDILDFPRDNRLDVGESTHEGPFYVQKMVHYDAEQKGVFKAAVEELVAEGLVEKHE
jgi:hypothetical protein